MAVRWPDGSVTGSVRVPSAPAPAEPEPETQEPVEPTTKSEKKEASDGHR